MIVFNRTKRPNAFFVVLPVLAFIASALISNFMPMSARAQADTPAPERLAVLNFWAFNAEGHLVPKASESDLAKLAAVLPRAVEARLVQSGNYTVVDESVWQVWTDDDAVADDNLEQYELHRAEQLLRENVADEIVTGSIAQIQQSVVLTLRRYAPGVEGPELKGAAVVRANNAGDAVTSVDNLMTQAFPPESDVVAKPIARVFVVPNMLRLPIGSQSSLQAYAVDDLGRPLPSVTMLYESNDDTRVLVDDAGTVTGVSPGRAQVIVQPFGRAAVSNLTLPKVDVSVVGPSLGLRAGTSLAAGTTNQYHVGLRMTPTHEIRTSSTTQTLPQAGANPVNVLTSLFGSLIGNQMLTVDLDVFPGQDISMALNAVQRSARSYFGTGIGVVVPIRDGVSGGILLRLSMGVQLPFTFNENMTHPVEVFADFIIGGAQNSPRSRIGIGIGLDLFQ